MKKLIYIFTILISFFAGCNGVALAQTPTSPVQLTTNTPYLEPSTGLHWYYNGSTYLWYKALGVKDSTYYVTPYYFSQHATPIGTALLKANNLSDVANAATSLSNINGVSLLGSYVNPAWLVSLPNTKITYIGSSSNFVKGNGSITALTSGDVTTALGFTPENASNKATTFGTLNNTLYPTTQAVANYVTGATSPYYGNYNYLSRNYDAYVTVSTTITAAVAAISDASSTKRYRLYVPNGTYNSETIVTKNYVDIIGQSQSGVIVNSSSQTDPTIQVTGSETMIANMTVTHTTNIGQTHQYPIHADDGSTLPHGQTIVIYNVTAQTLGTFTPTPPLLFGAIGVGLWAGQKMYLVNVTGISTTMPGLLFHNTGSQSFPTDLTLINCTGTSTNSYGFYYGIEASGQNDKVNIVGGGFTGGLADIYTENISGGTGQLYIQIDLLTTGTKTITAGNLLNGTSNIYSQQNQITETKNHLMGADGIWDIGTSNYNRPRDLWVYRKGYFGGGISTSDSLTFHSSVTGYQGTIWGVPGTNDLGFYRGTTNIGRMTNTGVFLWGTSSQSYSGSSAEFNGATYANGAVVSTSGFAMYTGGVTYRADIYSDLSTSDLIFRNGASVTERMRILNSDGSLQIGYTTNPSAGSKLGVNGDIYGNGKLTLTGTITNTGADNYTVDPTYTPLTKITQGYADGRYAPTSGGTYVSSVSGTTNRITSTGATTPVLDISSTFEALLGKVANPLSQFAATTSAQLRGVLSDESGTGAAIFAGSPTFTGTPLSPTITLTQNANAGVSLLNSNYGRIQTFSSAAGAIPAGWIYSSLGSNSLSLLGSGDTGAAGQGVNIIAYNGGTYNVGLRYNNVASGTPVLELFPAGVGTVNVASLTASQLVATDASKNLTNITALPSGTTAITQSPGDNSTKVATTAYVAANAGAGFAPIGTDGAAQTASFSITNTSAAVDASYNVSASVLINSITASTLTVTVTYTDETNTSRTLTFFGLGLTTAALSTTGVSDFPIIGDLRVKASTDIIVTWAVGGTNVINFTPHTTLYRTR